MTAGRAFFATLAVVAAAALLFAGSATAAPDVDPPVIAIASPTTNQQLNQSQPNVQFSATDPNLATVTCQVDAQAPVACSSGTWQVPAPLTDGGHSVTVWAADAFANSDSLSVLFFVDTVAPTLEITAPLDGATISVSTPDVSMTTGADALRCAFDAGAFSACNANFVAASLPNGPHRLTVRGSDAAGNVTERVVSFTIDDPGQKAAPTRGTFSSRSGRAAGGKFVAKIAGSVRITAGFDAAQACSGKATLAVKANSGGRKLSARQTVELTPGAGACAVRAKFKLPAGFKRARASVTLRYAGNLYLSDFYVKGAIKRL